MEKLSILAFSFSVNVLNRVDSVFFRLHIKSYGKCDENPAYKKIGYLTVYFAFHVYDVLSHCHESLSGWVCNVCAIQL